MKRCTKCVMPENYPGIKFDANGVCSHCHKYDKLWGNWVRNPDVRQESERKLKGIFEKAKSKNKQYDCLVPLSGGKDSLLVL